MPLDVVGVGNFPVAALLFFEEPSMRIKSLVIALCLIAFSRALQAQTDIDTDLFAGRVSEPDTTRRSTLTPRAASDDEMQAMIMDVAPDRDAQPRYELLLNPVFVDSDAAQTATLTTGVIVPARRLRATLSYSSIDPTATGDHRDSYGAAIRWKAWAREGAGLTIIGSHADTRDVSRKTQAGLVAEFLIRGPLSVGTDLRWARKASASASAAEDVVPLVTAGLNFGTIIFGGGYTFHNEVDGADNFDFQVEVPLKFGSIVGAVGKHGTWRAAYSRKFAFK